MGLSERQNEIIDLMKKEGYITVKYLVEKLNYSSATINRDLNELQLKGMIKRSYGGAEFINTAYINVTNRERKMQQEKRRIGKVAASFVKDGDTIFIDASTTAQCMKQYLENVKDLTVVTNNIVLVLSLSEMGIKTVCLGGEVVESPSRLYGKETEENILGYKFDKVFFSSCAVSKDGLIGGGIYDIMLKTAMRRSNEIFYVVDHEKTEKPFNIVLCDFSDVDYVISDYDFPDKTKSNFKNVNFIVADKD